MTQPDVTYTLTEQPTLRVGEKVFSLTAHEVEQARKSAATALRTRLEKSKPNRANYEVGASSAAITISNVLHWARFSILPIAIAMGLASAIRNVTAVYQNYTASGVVPMISFAAAIMFVIGVEAALFVLALAQQGIDLERRAARRERHVASLADLWRGIKVRLGAEQPRRYDQLPEKTNLGLVLALAFLFAITANVVIGLAPALVTVEVDAAGQPVITAREESLQDYLSSIPDKPARDQLAFFLDLMLALLPPAMATIGGHLIARYAAEYAEQSNAGRTVYEADLAAWRSAIANPLDDEEGQDVLSEYLRDKLAQKAQRAGVDPNPTPAAAPQETPSRTTTVMKPVTVELQQMELALPAQPSTNGNGAHG